MRRSNLITRLGGRSREPGQAQRAARLMLVAILLLPQVVVPATITVNGNGSGITPGNGLCSLREAVNNANTDSDTSGGDCVAGSGPDTIVPLSNIELTAVDNSEGDGYGLTDARGVPVIYTDITIDGGGRSIARASNVVGTEPPPFGLFRIIPDGTLTLNDTILSNGENYHYYFQGPYYIYYRGVGGAVWNNGGNLAVNNSALSESLAYFGGGLCTDEGGTTTLVNSTISDNHARFAGGTILDGDYGTLSLLNSSVSGNYALFQGAGILTAGYNGSNTTLTNSTVSGNTTPNSTAGGIGAVFGSSVTLTDSTVSGNASLAGGGILASSYGNVILNNSTISGNSASFSGGGILARRGASATVVNSTVSGNYAQWGGGTYAVGYATATITNSTFSGNEASSGAGGGVYTYDYPPTSGYYAGTTDLANTIVANSSGTDCGGSVPAIDSGNNFSGDLSCPGSDLITPGVDFDTTLQNNGGPTETHALTPVSVALEAAVNCGLFGDQRGFPRCYACDSGSYELLEDPEAGCDCILIDGPDKVTANEKFNLDLVCANPNSRLLVGGGRNNDFSSRFVPGCGVVQFGIGPRPNNFGTTMADGNGDATSSQTLGDSFGNSTIYFQVVDSSKCELSPVLPVFVNMDGAPEIETRLEEAVARPSTPGLPGQRLMSRPPNETRMGRNGRWSDGDFRGRSGGPSALRARPDSK